jgi:hypothetical protein
MLRRVTDAFLRRAGYRRPNCLILKTFHPVGCTFNQSSEDGRKMPGSLDTLRPCRIEPVAKTDPHSPLAASCHLTSGLPPVTEF